MKAQTPVERLLNAVLQRPQHELLHESDCPACDMAAEIVATLSVH